MSEQVVYLDVKTVIGKRETEAPANRSKTGYGPKIPTSWELQLTDKRWRRVYVAQYSNSGTAYIIVDGERHVIGEIDSIPEATQTAA